MNKQLSYLIGLICARGHLFVQDRRIIIEFAHKNKSIVGIAHCPKCGNLATEKKDGNPDQNLICKACGTLIDKSVKKVYEQQKSTLQSLNQVIIPFLASPNIDFNIVGNDHMTLLIIDCIRAEEYFTTIQTLFSPNMSFDSFVIPKEMYATNQENKKEFITGFLDAAGFFNSGGWLNREGKHGIGRMRAYFQIVRNWKMPVLICNYLKELNFPIHTIDWGHPNIRDSSMEDYYNSNPLSWSREHQVKFFPEYYKVFKLRLKHKQEMFEELIQHNEKVGFDNSDDCSPPKPITTKTLKPYHFGENDPRIPTQVRKHYDAYWQVCNDLGCIFSNICIRKSKNPEAYYLTGKDEKINYDEVKKQFINYRNDLTSKIVQSYKGMKSQLPKKAGTTIRQNPEYKLYEPIAKWLERHLRQKYSQNVLVFNTSSFYLDKFILQNNLFDQFDFCDEYKIKPDLVGFLLKSKNLVFVEVKVGQLTLKDIGQLLGYSLVAQPELAILTSPEKPSISLMKILKSNLDILKYSESKRIIISYWEDSQLHYLDY